VKRAPCVADWGQGAFEPRRLDKGACGPAGAARLGRRARREASVLASRGPGALIGSWGRAEELSETA